MRTRTRRATGVLLLLGVLPLASCAGGETPADAGAGKDATLRSTSDWTGYDVGESFRRTGAQGEQMCRDTLNMTVLNPKPGENLKEMFEGCFDAVRSP